MLLLYPDLSSVFPSHLKTKETFFQRLTELSKICFLIGFRYYSSCFCPPNPTHSSDWPADIHTRVFAVIVPCAVNHDSSASDLMSRGDQRSLACQSSLRVPSTSIFSILLGSYWYIAHADLRCKIWFDFPPSFSICALLLVFLLHATSYLVLFKYFCFCLFSLQYKL